MRKMISCVLILLLYSFVHRALFAGSILSSRGLGIPLPPPDARSAGMAGMSAALSDPYSISGANPAGLVTIRTTLIALHFTAENSRFQTRTGTNESGYSNFNGFIFAVPLKNGLGMAIHMAPLTRMNYAISYPNQVGDQSYTKSVEGRGGIDAVSFSLFWAARKWVSIGLTGNFVFGKNSETWKILWDNSSEISSSNSQYSVRHTGYGWTVGIQMQPLPYLKLGGTVSPSYRIHSATDLYYGFYLDKKDSHFQFPLCWNAAALAALGKNASWGLEYSEQQWNRFSMIQDLRKSRSIATGGEFYGLKNPMAPYLKKMAYRIGFSYKPFFCPDISGNTINEYWGTLGFGFPLASGISQVDAAFGIGKRGSTKTNAFSEMLYQIGVTVTVGEKWQGQGE